MLSIDHGKALGDTQLQIRAEICRGESQKLSFTDAGPEQYVEGKLRIGLVSYGDKHLELIQCPNLHCIRITLTHAAGFHTWIVRKLIVPYGIIHYGGHFVIDRFQVSGSVAGIRLLLISLLPHPTLPLPDIQFVDLIDRLFLEEGQEHTGKALFLPGDGCDIGILPVSKVSQIIIH